MSSGTLVPVDSKRSYGLDALRSASMFMVLIMHILSKGGIFLTIDQGSPFTAEYFTAWFLETFCYCCVNCFALISGYFGISSRYRYTNLAMLWLRVVFYTVGVTLVFQIVWPDKMGWQRWPKSFFPVIFEHYWYFTAYFIMFLLIPLFNLALNKLTQKQSGALVLGVLLAMCVIQTIPNKDIFRIDDNGCSGWWLSAMYLLGGYIRKYDLFKKVTKLRCFLVYVLASAVTFASELVLDYFKHSYPSMPGGKDVNKYLCRYYSPAVVIAAVALFMFFAKLDVRSKPLQKIITFFAPVAFSVYLIHYAPLVRDKLLKNSMGALTELGAPLMGLAVIGIAVAVFISCSLIDWIRELLFRKLKLRERLLRLENRLIGDRWDNYLN